MKKLLTLILALVMVFTLSVPAMAAEDDGTATTTVPTVTENGGSQNATVTGSYYSPEVAEVYSVEVSWGSMAFTYDAGTYDKVWNPDKLEYELELNTPGQGWIYNGNNKVTVTNRSNLAINVAVVAEVKAEYATAGITANVDKGTFTLDNAATNASYDENSGEESTDTATITLEGALARTDAVDAVLGSVTVIITSGPIDVLTDSTVASTELSGSGTEENPYLIQSAADLLYLSQADLNIISDGVYYKLTTDIVVTASTWKPISEFRGTFDGGSHTISGTLACTDTLAGVFGSLYGTVKDLNVSATIYTSYTTYSVKMGGIAGIAQSNSTISKCTFSGTIEKPNDLGSDAYIGGIAGQAYGTITGCTNTGTVNGPDIKEIAGDGEVYYTLVHVGGIAGSMLWGSITGCTHSGKITPGNDNNYTDATPYYGSIAGYVSRGTVCTTCNKNESTTNLEPDWAKIGYIGTGTTTTCDTCTAGTN